MDGWMDGWMGSSLAGLVTNITNMPTLDGLLFLSSPDLLACLLVLSTL